MPENEKREKPRQRKRRRNRQRQRKRKRELKPKSCLDINGQYKAHGTYYTPVKALCTLCLCENGAPDGCIKLRCQTPECDDYEQVSNTCCHYRCPGENTYTDKTTLAVVVSLVVVLLLTLAAITFIVRKMKRSQGRFSEPKATSSSHITHTHQLQETRMTPTILLNSVPNNLRVSEAMLPPIPPKCKAGSSRACSRERKDNNEKLLNESSSSGNSKFHLDKVKHNVASSCGRSNSDEVDLEDVQISLETSSTLVIPTLTSPSHSNSSTSKPSNCCLSKLIVE